MKNNIKLLLIILIGAFLSACTKVTGNNTKDVWIHRDPRYNIYVKQVNVDGHVYFCTEYTIVHSESCPCHEN